MTKINKGMSEVQGYSGSKIKKKTDITTESANRI